MSMASYLSSFHNDEYYLMDEEFFAPVQKKEDQ
jgi:hypothetical protein